ncbi:hypothetical protein Hden_0655 [Hyphomicrobium denitrificans ATCC 51888]|uniref:Uncharacterized protein n=1 Tax=Hyphomicrobium denitrificans (strain ATCC 51888 / DSM 1869 / NCIMB 11706 / TK 0415) TaxID=582899 RepID=D8JSZ1_HYPDA|nr:hypothetical protein [Hyphomicrobium denitrificans]ADJ22476.1 hypothetical protein Hden_0655 [Hyphomicrobium denitrificans ATCC 51888]
MRNFAEELAQAKARLADAEAALTAGVNPYAEQNVATHRARVARLEAEAGHFAPEPNAPAPVSEPIAAAPIPKPARQLTGTREEQLRRLARAMEADERALAEAIAVGTTPDEFALQIVEDRDPEAVALRIAYSHGPVTRKATPDVEEMVQRILNA